MLGNGDGTFGPTARIDGGPQPESMVTGDFDLTESGHRVGNAPRKQCFGPLGKGDGNVPGRLILGNPGWPQCVATADLNHDGWPDLVVGISCLRRAATVVGSNVTVFVNNGGPHVGFDSPSRR